MPRQVRIQYPGALYHAMSRGNRRQDIYLDDVDRQDFIKTLAESCQKTGWQVHAYCLMPLKGGSADSGLALTPSEARQVISPTRKYSASTAVRSVPILPLCLR